MNDKITNYFDRSVQVFKNKLIAQMDRIKYLEKEKEKCIYIDREDVYKCKTPFDYQILVLKEINKKDASKEK